MVRSETCTPKRCVSRHHWIVDSANSSHLLLTAVNFVLPSHYLILFISFADALRWDYRRCASSTSSSPLDPSSSLSSPCLATFAGHMDATKNAIPFPPHHLLSLSFDGTARLFDFSEPNHASTVVFTDPQLLRMACAFPEFDFDLQHFEDWSEEADDLDDNSVTKEIFPIAKLPKLSPPSVDQVLRDTDSYTLHHSSHHLFYPSCAPGISNSLRNSPFCCCPPRLVVALRDCRLVLIHNLTINMGMRHPIDLHHVSVNVCLAGRASSFLLFLTSTSISISRIGLWCMCPSSASSSSSSPSFDDISPWSFTPFYFLFFFSHILFLLFLSRLLLSPSSSSSPSHLS